MAVGIKQGVASGLEVQTADIAADAVITAKISAAQVTYAKADIAVIGVTTSATAATQTSHAHGLGRAPNLVSITPLSSNVIYQSSAAGTTYIYLKSASTSQSASVVCW